MHKGGADDKNREGGEEESVIFFHRWRRSSSSGASKLEGGFCSGRLWHGLPSTPLFSSISPLFCPHGAAWLSDDLALILMVSHCSLGPTWKEAGKLEATDF